MKVTSSPQAAWLTGIETAGRAWKYFRYLEFNDLWHRTGNWVLAGVLKAMIHRFARDRRGNYALMTVITMVPIMGGVALAVDYTELVRQRQQTLNALDAAGIATAQQIVSGASDDSVKAYAKDFFEANLGRVKSGEHDADRHAP
jgi:hypothetical protein